MYKKAAASKVQQFFSWEKQRIQPREVGEVGKTPLRGLFPGEEPLARVWGQSPQLPLWGNQVADDSALNAEFVCDLHFAP